jgi:hypothetical protein
MSWISGSAKDYIARSRAMAGLAGSFGLNQQSARRSNRDGAVHRLDRKLDVVS